MPAQAGIQSNDEALWIPASAEGDKRVGAGFQPARPVEAAPRVVGDVPSIGAGGLETRPYEPVLLGGGSPSSTL